MTPKPNQYEALVAKRKKCRLCVGLSNPADRSLRRFDSCEIGPWSLLHGDLNAQLMIVGQDWGDVDYYVCNQGMDNLRNPTMRNLEKILRHIGMDLSITSYSARNRGLFLTNAILCLKSGGLQAKIDPAWVDNCGNRFLRQQVEIVRPKVIVGLGAFAFHALLRAFGQTKRQLRDAICDKAGIEILTDVRLFAAYHCGAGTINRNRNLQQQFKDWKRIGSALQRASRGRTKR